MSRILFVDDDRLILRGLRRQLHSCGVDWQLEFAPGGPEALDAIAARPFDVVVSDMQMPVVDGAAVLARVAETQPRAARLVLSGHADPERSRLASSCAHRHLNKPCSTELLELEIQQALTMRDLLDDLGEGSLADMWCRPASRVSGGEDLLSGLHNMQNKLPVPVLELLAIDTELWDRTRAVLVATYGEDVGPNESPEKAASRVGVSTVLATLIVVRFLQTFDGQTNDRWNRAIEMAALACTVSREQGLSDEAIIECQLAALIQPFVFRDRGQVRINMLAYLLPTWGFSEPVITALTSDDETPLQAAGPGPALAAARLQRGDAASDLLCKRLEEVGWSSRIAAWKELATR